MTLRPAGSAERFERAPIGHWVAGPSYLVWNWSPRLGGLILWGQPVEPDIQRLFGLVDAYHRFAPGCDVVTDVSRIVAVDATAYEALVAGMRARVPHFSASVRRHALVRSEGLLGGLAEGFFPLVAAQHQWRVFPTAAAAFAWLDHADGKAALEAVERVVDEARGVPAPLRQLRDFIRAQLGTAKLPAAARALGLSERTLHRALREAGTSFRAELAAARVDAARKLLAETDLKIEAVAARSGCCSHAHLTRLFGRATGQSPKAYREQARLARRVDGGFV